MDNTADFKELVKLIPYRYGYATRIVEKLRTNGVYVSQSTVYHVINGKSKHPEIIGAFLDLVEEARAKQEVIEQRIKTLQQVQPL
jgi:ABC-type hemin transport system substrate-binding protein